VDRNTFFYRNLTTNCIERITLRYSQFSPKKVFELPLDEEIFDFFVDRSDPNHIFIIGMTKDLDSPLFLREVLVEGNQKGKQIRNQQFETEDSKVSTLFQTVNAVIDGLFIGDHYVFEWTREGQIEMFDNIFGIDETKEQTAYNSPLIDGGYRKLVYIIKRNESFSQAIIVPYLRDRRIILDSKKSKK